jgi:hypothetical protein
VPAWYLDWQAFDRGRRPGTIRAYGADLAGFRAFAGAADVGQLADVDRDLPRGREREPGMAASIRRCLPGSVRFSQQA